MSILEKITQQCDRTDCRFAFDDSGVTNSAGHYSGVTCRTCKRQWSIFSPSRLESAIYDREGNLINPPPPVEVKEVMREP